MLKTITVKQKRKERKEEIPAEYLIYYRLKRKFGDIESIAFKTKIRRNTIAQAINDGKCTKRIAKALRNYYKPHKDPKFNELIINKTV